MYFNLVPQVASRALSWDCWSKLVSASTHWDCFFLSSLPVQVVPLQQWNEIWSRQICSIREVVCCRCGTAYSVQYLRYMVRNVIHNYACDCWDFCVIAIMKCFVWWQSGEVNEGWTEIWPAELETKDVHNWTASRSVSSFNRPDAILFFLDILASYSFDPFDCKTLHKTALHHKSKGLSKNVLYIQN